MPDTQGFLGVCTDITLHLTPDGGSLYLADPAAQAGRDDLQIAHFEVNRMGARILQSCDGTNTVRELIDGLLREFPADRTVINKALPAFLKELKDRQIIQVSHDRRPVHLPITGSAVTYYPVHVLVELTSSCNLHCSHCYRESSPRESPRLETARLLAVLDELARSGTRLVELSGGEPTAHPDFMQILQHCAGRFNLISVLTNGTLLDKESIDAMAAYHQKLVLQIDLDSADAATHDSFRGAQGAHQKACQSIQLAANSGLITRVAMTVVPDTITQIEETLLQAKKLGATIFSVGTVVQAGRAIKRSLHFSPLELLRLLESLRRLQEAYSGFYFQVPQEVRDRQQVLGNCGAGYHSCVVDPIGDVRPCPLLSGTALTLGNLARSAVAEVFINPVVNFLRSLRAPESEFCGDCRFINHCRSCLFRALAVRRHFRPGDSCRWAAAYQVDAWFSVNRPQEGHAQKACMQTGRDFTLTV